MALGLVTLLAALSISVVAAYFSIVGLAALFAAAAMPVIIMGSVLEVGKLVSVVWLHNNWKTAPSTLKYYLVISVIILMLITSLGIFGFLSKGHLDQKSPGSEVDLKIERINQKIDSEERNIVRLQKRIDQLDDAIVVYFDNDFATRGLKALEDQKQQRDSIATEMADREKRIDIYLEQRSEERIKKNEITAKLGPVKYISDLIFENPEDKIDSAVRGVILMIVFAFDPLAVLLLIAATHTFTRRRREDKVEEKTVSENPVYDIPDEYEPPKEEELPQEEPIDDLYEEINKEMEQFQVDKHSYLSHNMEESVPEEDTVEEEEQHDDPISTEVHSDPDILSDTGDDMGKDNEESVSESIGEEHSTDSNLDDERKAKDDTKKLKKKKKKEQSKIEEIRANKSDKGSKNGGWMSRIPGPSLERMKNG